MAKIWMQGAIFLLLLTKLIRTQEIYMRYHISLQIFTQNFILGIHIFIAVKISTFIRRTSIIKQSTIYTITILKIPK